jgi:hypothetical protein
VALSRRAKSRCYNGKGTSSRLRLNFEVELRGVHTDGCTKPALPPMIPNSDDLRFNMRQNSSMETADLSRRLPVKICTFTFLFFTAKKLSYLYIGIQFRFIYLVGMGDAFPRSWINLNRSTN